MAWQDFVAWLRDFCAHHAHALTHNWYQCDGKKEGGPKPPRKLLDHVLQFGLHSAGRVTAPCLGVREEVEHHAIA